MKDAHDWFLDIELEKRTSVFIAPPKEPRRPRWWTCQNCNRHELSKTKPGTRKTLSRLSCKEQQVRIVCES